MDSGIIKDLLIIAAVSVGFIILSKVFPFKQRNESEGLSFDELREKYAKWEMASIVPFFLFAGLLTFVWYKIILYLEELSSSSIKEALFLITPSVSVWVIPAISLAIITSAIPLHFLYKTLLGERFKEYLLYSQLQSGYDYWKVLGFFAVVIILSSSLAIFLLIDCYTSFTQDSIVINRFFSLSEETYPYSAIRKIQKVFDLKLSSKNENYIYYVIEFENGAIWKSIDGARDSELEQDSKIMDFVSKKSGKVIDKEFPL